MDFSSSLEYLYGLQRFGIKLGLQNMRVMQERLPLLQNPLFCVHVAGTNGKGSVSVMLAEILKHSGLRTGLYTSPHLHCFTERIRIDGVPLAFAEVAALATTIRHAAGDLPVTFFEATTAMALLAFRNASVDIAVIETGLGGRLDATNIVNPKLCMITPVSMDHTQQLGNSLAEIASEKAGILKTNVPVVVGRQTPEVIKVIQTAAEKCAATVSLSGRDFFRKGDHGKLMIVVGDSQFSDLTCALPGEHQLDNYAQAVAGAVQLRAQGIAISDSAIRRAGETVRWPGRLEWFGGTQKVLLDVSHNRAGIACLVDYLTAQGVSRFHLVTGLSGERDPEEVLLPLVKSTVAVYAVPVLCDQSITTAKISSWAKSHDLPVSEYSDASAGLDAALCEAGHEVPVVVCGSLYLAAELRRKLQERELSAGHIAGTL